jgi:hypothetical protein
MGKLSLQNVHINIFSVIFKPRAQFQKFCKCSFEVKREMNKYCPQVGDKCEPFSLKLGNVFHPT